MSCAHAAPFSGSVDWPPQIGVSLQDRQLKQERAGEQLKAEVDQKDLLLPS